MGSEELLKLLDLKAQPPPVALTGAGAAPAARDGSGAPAPEASPTALAVDAWGLRRGRDLVAESDRLRACGTDDHAAADFFCAAFDPDPVLNAACADPVRHSFVARLLDAPEYRALHADTRLDDTAAAIAAVHFAEQFARLKEAAPEPDGREHAVGGGAEFAAEVAALRAAGAALSAARAEVDELRDATLALGMGPGGSGSTDPRAVAELFRRVRADPTLRRVCELAGRFRRVARSKQRLKVAHGLDDVVGVEPGGEVARLLPFELARLMVPELELDALRRIAERQALCRAHSAVEPVGKGPVLVVVDESGSMEGAKVHTAKALALALAWVARHQRRWCGLIAYSGNTGERLLALPPARWDERALCGWLCAFIGGGSALDVPIDELPRMYREIGAPVGGTDLVIVTDAQCVVPARSAERFRAWKQQARVRATALVIGSDPGALAELCEEVHRVPALDPAAEAVGRVLAL